MFEYYVYSYGMHIIGLLLVAVAGCLGLGLRNCLSRWVKAESNRQDDEAKVNIAKTVAAFVEQAWKDLHGPDKLRQALETAEVMLKKKGIPFDADEMLILIEAAVAEFNEVFRKPIESENAAGTYRVPDLAEIKE